jgi:hypothetical protein
MHIYVYRNVELMIANKGLNLLMDRLADKRDPILLKIIRNISQWTFNQQQELESPELNYKYRGLWSPHVKVLLEILHETDSHDMLVEVPHSPHPLRLLSHTLSSLLT